MSMVIGKEAREAVKSALERWMRGEHYSSLMQTVGSVLDRCTDAPEVGLPEGWVAVPREPSDAHLMSMALRNDHAVGLRTQEAIQSALRSMRQLYEEATGQGFYAIDGSNSERYRQMIPVADHAGLSGARLPDGWPWDDVTRQDLALLIAAASDGLSGDVDRKVIDGALESIARWIESAGQKEKQG